MTRCHQHTSHFLSGHCTLISDHPTVAVITASALPGSWQDSDVCFAFLKGTDCELHEATNFRQAAKAKSHSIMFSLTHQEFAHLKGVGGF